MELYDVIDFWEGDPNPVTGQPWPAVLPFTGYRNLGILEDGRAALAAPANVVGVGSFAGASGESALFVV